jgi:hypothetical protein
MSSKYLLHYIRKLAMCNIDHLRFYNEAKPSFILGNNFPVSAQHPLRDPACKIREGGVCAICYPKWRGHRIDLLPEKVVHLEREKMINCEKENWTQRWKMQR